MDKIPNLEDHEVRIIQLELVSRSTQKSLDNLKSAVDSSQARSEVMSEIVMKQNETLISQNDRLSNQVSDMVDTLSNTNEKEKERNHEMKKLRTDTRTKMWTLIIGSGSLGYLVIETLLSLFGQ